MVVGNGVCSFSGRQSAGAPRTGLRTQSPTLVSGTRMKPASRQLLSKPFMYTTIALGAVAASYSVWRISVPDLGLPFLLLALITLCFGSRIVVAIPRTKGIISVSDTFILLT